MAFNPIVIEKGLNVRFAREMAQFQAARSLSPGIMAANMMIPSTGAYEKLGWLGAMPTVQQWLGELQAKKLEDYDYTVKNLDWAAAAFINENDVADDQTGVHSMFPQMLVQRIMKHPEELTIDLLIDGDTKLAFDGSAFFADRSVNDNLLAGSGYTTASTKLANMSKDLSAALIAMAKFVDDQGKPLNLRGNLIVCPVALEDDFRRLVQSQADPLATGGVNTFNPFANRSLSVIGDARLDADDSTDWYLLCTNEIIKPFVFSMRQNAQNRFQQKNLTKTWVWSADYRGNAGYGLPHLAIKTVNS